MSYVLISNQAKKEKEKKKKKKSPWYNWDSNRGHLHYKANDLPTELNSPIHITRKVKKRFHPFALQLSIENLTMFPTPD